MNEHYNVSYTRALTAEEIKAKRVTIIIDPYRVCEIYGIGGGAREQILKKALRYTSKGQPERDVLSDIICAAKRRLDMLDEDVCVDVPYRQDLVDKSTAGIAAEGELYTDINNMYGKQKPEPGTIGGDMVWDEAPADAEYYITISNRFAKRADCGSGWMVWIDATGLWVLLGLVGSRHLDNWIKRPEPETETPEPDWVNAPSDAQYWDGESECFVKFEAIWFYWTCDGYWQHSGYGNPEPDESWIKRPDDTPHPAAAPVDWDNAPEDAEYWMPLSSSFVRKQQPGPGWSVWSPVTISWVARGLTGGTQPDWIKRPEPVEIESGGYPWSRSDVLSWFRDFPFNWGESPNTVGGWTWACPDQGDIVLTPPYVEGKAGDQWIEYTDVRPAVAVEPPAPDWDQAPTDANLYDPDEGAWHKLELPYVFTWHSRSNNWIVSAHSGTPVPAKWVRKPVDPEPETVTGEPNTDSTIDPVLDDGWIEWNCTQGGKPDEFGSNTIVEVKLRDDHRLVGDHPGAVHTWCWGRMDNAPGCEIIAYRVVTSNVDIEQTKGDCSVDPDKLDDGWIEWNCHGFQLRPDLLSNTRVEVKLRDDNRVDNPIKSILLWQWYAHPHNPANEIIAYRVVTDEN